MLTIAFSTTLNVFIIKASQTASVEIKRQIHTTPASNSLHYNACGGKIMQQSWILMCEMSESPAASGAFEASSMIEG